MCRRASEKRSAISSYHRQRYALKDVLNFSLIAGLAVDASAKFLQERNGRLAEYAARFYRDGLELESPSQFGIFPLLPIFCSLCGSPCLCVRLLDDVACVRVDTCTVPDEAFPPSVGKCRHTIWASTVAAIQSHRLQNGRDASAVECPLDGVIQRSVSRQPAGAQ